MAKRGRKPKERKGYFYEKEEQAIIAAGVDVRAEKWGDFPVYPSFSSKFAIKSSDHKIMELKE